MFLNFFKSISQVNKLSNSINFNHNLKYIEKIEITVWNPSHKSLFKTVNFEACLHLKKDDSIFYKNFYNNNYEKLLKDLQSFVETEIKI
jgi:hypothetical protein